MKAKQPICFHIHAEQVIPDKPGIAHILLQNMNHIIIRQNQQLQTFINNFTHNKNTHKLNHHIFFYNHLKKYDLQTYNNTISS